METAFISIKKLQECDLDYSNENCIICCSVAILNFHVMIQGFHAFAIFGQIWSRDFDQRSQ